MYTKNIQQKYTYNKMKNLSNYGDILAIPFFLLLVIYFNDIKEKTYLEYLLFFFSICGLLLDTCFTYIFLSKKRR